MASSEGGMVAVAMERRWHWGVVVGLGGSGRFCSVQVVPPLAQVTATDADSGAFGSLSYSIGSGIGSVIPTQFSIDKHSGQLCTVQPLDRDEGTAAYDFTITAVDGVSAAEAACAVLLSRPCAGVLLSLGCP